MARRTEGGRTGSKMEDALVAVVVRRCGRYGAREARRLVCIVPGSSFFFLFSIAVSGKVDGAFMKQVFLFVCLM